ncbi:MAG: peptide chain release factor 1 [Pseudomonadota bacterium]
MSVEQNLETLAERLKAIDAQMAQETQSETIVALARERSEIEPVVTTYQARLDAEAERNDLKALLDDPETDPEMRDLAETEFADLDARVEALQQDLRLLLLPRDAADQKGAILEIRAGTGGDEAALFAGDLFRMYQRFAELEGWKVAVISESASDLGGYRELVAEVTGTGVYAKLKFESGAHRVQRVPETESGGRIHTSAATVAVLPEAEEVDVEIEDKDLRIDVFRASGAGGQHVNTTDSAVRITHLPTGIVVSQQDERSQHKNKAKALKLLRAKLFDIARTESETARAEARKGLVGSGDRSERIRTYNFPQGRVTDHRINLTLYKLDRILAGEALGDVTEALVAEDQARRLAAADGLG